MAYNPKGVANAQTEAGIRRQAIEKRVTLLIRDWLDGRPGDLCMGDLYAEFFRGQKDKTRG